MKQFQAIFFASATFFSISLFNGQVAEAKKCCEPKPKVCCSALKEVKRVAVTPPVQSEVVTKIEEKQVVQEVVIPQDAPVSEPVVQKEVVEETVKTTNYIPGLF